MTDRTYVVGMRQDGKTALARQVAAEAQAQGDVPTCPRCGSPRWVSVSLDGGYTRRAQCVPCGAYHRGVIGPGWRSADYGDPEAVAKPYRRVTDVAPPSTDDLP